MTATGRPALADVVVRPMRERQIGRIVAIERRVHPRPWSAQLFEDELQRRDTRRYVVALARTRWPWRSVVGYGGVLLQADDAHITTIAVDPAHHRRKVGTHLVLRLLTEARAMGAQQATLEVRAANRGAQRLYSAFGFVPVGVRPRYYAETGEDAVVMTVAELQSDECTRRLAAQTARLADPGGASGAPDEPVPWVRRRSARKGGS